MVMRIVHCTNVIRIFTIQCQEGSLLYFGMTSINIDELLTLNYRVCDISIYTIFHQGNRDLLQHLPIKKVIPMQYFR